MRTINQAGDLNGKKILVRVDFDVPVEPTTNDQRPTTPKIAETFRIIKQKELLDDLVGQGAQVVMVAHISDKSVSESFAAIMPQLHLLLGHEINFIKSVADIGGYLEHYAGPALLDNIRQNLGEETNDEGFARSLAEGFDLYINNAFAVCHRNHASVSAITKFLPSYAGPLIEKEVAELQKIVDASAEGKVIIMGGAKASTKVPVIKNLIEKTEAVLLGGVVANDVLKEKGQDMGSSVVDVDAHELLAGLDLNHVRLIIPTDFVVFDNKILDIGDQTIKKYIDLIQKAKLIVWNGPMGLFENPVFAKGTNEIAKAIAAAAGYSIIGGGDTISAVDKIGLLDKPTSAGGFNFVSTGGGAMLTFLAGEKLPGLTALQ